MQQPNGGSVHSSYHSADCIDLMSCVHISILVVMCKVDWDVVVLLCGMNKSLVVHTCVFTVVIVVLLWCNEYECCFSFVANGNKFLFSLTSNTLGVQEDQSYAASLLTDNLTNN